MERSLYLSLSLRSKHFKDLALLLSLLVELGLLLSLSLRSRQFVDLTLHLSL